jgi:S-methylmethionine-dependent homocysteine/selenocysteine methylase
VHHDFAAAGAQMISTNSYAVVPFHIGADRFASDGAHLAALAGKLAHEVAAQRGVKVAGSLPPVLGSYRPDLFEKTAAKAIHEVLIAALSPYADIWLAETLSTIAEGALVSELLSGDERPLWLSFTLKDDGAPALRSGETIAEAAALAKRVGAAALLFNCSAPEVMEAAVAEAKDALSGTDIAIGVYANGFAAKAEDKDANVDLQQIRPDLDPPRYLDWAHKWVAAGATMVGGCCGIGAAHIAALSGGLNERTNH